MTRLASRLAALAALCLALVPAAARADDPSLELRWHLDAAGATTPESSGHGRTGSVTGGTALAGRYANGLTGTRVAAQFTGFPQPNQLSVSVWVKALSAPTGQPWIVAYGERSGCPAGTVAAFGLRATASGGVTFVTQGTTGDINTSPVAGPLQVWDGMWHHLVGVKTFQSVSLYLDGDLLGSNYGGDIVYGFAATPFAAGGAACPGEAAYTGGLDEVRFYSRPLTGREVDHLADPAATRAPVLPVPPARSNVSARYHLDGDATDSSGHGLDGKSVQAGSVPGRYGTAFSLSDAGDGFLVDDSPYLEPQELTVLAWVKAAANPGQYRTLVGKGSYNCSPQAWALHTDAAGNPDFYVGLYNQTGGHTAVQTGSVAAGTIWDGDWHALAGTYKDGVARMWVDGAAQPPASVPPADVGPGGPEEIDYPYYTQSSELSIGRYSHGAPDCDLNGFQYRGAIDEVRLYDRRLSGDQIQRLQSQAPTTPPDIRTPSPTPAPTTGLGPALQWHLDDTATVTDTSGNGNDGTVSGATPVADGRFGGAFSLPVAVAKIQAPASVASLDAPTPSILLWLRSKGTPAAGTIAGVGRPDAGACTPTWKLAVASDGNLVFSGDAFSADFDANLANAEVNLWDGGWHALGIRYDGEDVRAFTDGELRQDVVVNGGPLQYTGARAFRVGSVCGQPAAPVGVDEVRVYPRAVAGDDLRYETLPQHAVPPGLPAQDPPPHTDPIARYHLDGDGTDSSGHGLHASDVHGTNIPGGRFGGAFSFATDTDGIVVPSSPIGVTPLLAPQQLTVLAWAKRTGAPGQSAIVARGVGCSVDWGIVTTATGAVQFTVDARSPDGEDGARVFTPAAAVPWDGAWHALAGTFSDSTATLWVDGAKVASAPSEYDDVYYGTAFNPSLGIGRPNQYCPEQVFTGGAVDEARVYDRALTDAQLQLLQDPAASAPPELPTPLAAPTPQPEPDLNLKWHLDTPDENADLTPDSSGNDIDGTIEHAGAEPTARFRGGYSITPPVDHERVGIGVGANELLQPAQLTAMAWVRRAGATGGGVIVNYGGGCADVDYRISMTANGYVDFRADTRPDVIDTTDNAPISDRQWHPVVGTYDGSALRLYVDGVLIGTPKVVGSAMRYGAYEKGRFQVGDRFTAGCTSQPFAGDVDEVRLYSRALTADEVAYLAAGFHRKPPTLPIPPGPTDQSPPIFSGVPRVNNQVNCSTGTWTGNPDFTFLWERAPRNVTAAGDESWVAIDGAVGSSHTLTTNEDGLRVRCRVIATNAAGSREAVSNSKRVDVFNPTPMDLPTISGLPAVAGKELTCEHGSWTGNPDESDFIYRWTRGDTTIATTAKYTPKKLVNSQFYGDYNADGDSNQDIQCHVNAANDVGTGYYETATPKVFVVQSKPFAKLGSRSKLTITTEANPLQRTAACQHGDFYDDYAQHPDTAPQDSAGYRYQWFRRDNSSGDQTAIAGETGQTFKITVDVLGRAIACGATASNALGESEVLTSPDEFIPLPAQSGNFGGRIEISHRNELDPVNLMATGDQYRTEAAKLFRDRLHAAADALAKACPSVSGFDPAVKETYQHPPDSLDPSSPVQLKTICYLLNLRTADLEYQYNGLRWDPGNQYANCPGTYGCRPILLPIEPVDASTVKALPLDVQERLRPLTPQRILWDVDGDGRTDISCPGTSPVIRGELNVGTYHPQATIVNPDSAQTGQFIHAEWVTPYFSFPSKTKEGGNRPPAALRHPQPFWCRNSITPPADPKLAPCTSTGSVGQVLLRGNLCPVNVRGIDQAELDALPADIRSVVVAAARVINDREREQEKLIPGYDPGTRWTLLDRPLRSTADAEVAAAAQNTAASYAGIAAGTVRSNLDQALIDKMQALANGNVPNLPKVDVDPAKAAFALDQIYIANGPLNVNGVTVDPKGSLHTIISPSDVTNALPGSPRSMLLNAPHAALDLADKPLQEAKDAFKTRIDDAVGGAQTALKDEIDLSRIDPGKFNLGPFKLIGQHAKVTVNPDQTVTLEALASFPGLTALKPPRGADPKDEKKTGGDVTINAKIKGDLDGRLQLQGLKIKVGEAFLLGLHLKGLEVSYDNGKLDIKGQITFDFLGGAGIDIVKFGLSPKGALDALVINYVAGAGSGIPVGQGVFMTTIGGGFDARENKLQLEGNAAFSMLAPAASGGCPTIGAKVGVQLKLAPAPVELHSQGDVSIVCVEQLGAKITLDASSDGWAKLDSEFHVDVPHIVSVNGGIGGEVRTDPNVWQIDARGGVEFKFIPVSLKLKGVLSQRGVAACAVAKIPTPWPFDDLTLAAGAAVRFIGGIPPLTPAQLIIGFRAFTGCDLSAYTPLRSLNRRLGGVSTVTFPLDSDSTALSLEGAGAAPRVTLVSPSGKRYDYTDAEDGKFMEGAFGAVLPTEDRSVIMLRHPERGQWTAEPAPDSTPVVRVQQSQVLGDPQVKARVTGSGATRTLHYDVKPIPGQQVDFLELTDGHDKLLKKNVRGGKGTVRYTVGEADSAKRRIGALVYQDGLPRKQFELAPYSAPNPKVGRPRVRVRRSGSKATVTWSKAALASRYDIVVTYASGQRKLLTSDGKVRKVVVAGVGKRGTLRAAVTGYSLTQRAGRAGTAKLRRPARRHRRH